MKNVYPLLFSALLRGIEILSNSTKKTTLPVLAGLLALLVAVPAQGQIVLNEISYDGSSYSVEIKNQGGSQVNISGYYLCSFPNYSQLGNLTLESGSLLIDPGTLAVVSGFNGAGNASDDELGLYINSAFSSASSIIDYVEWGSTGHVRSSVAQSAGIWSNGDFVAAFATNGSLEYDGDGDASSDWEIESTPTLGAENTIGGGECTAMAGTLTADLDTACAAAGMGMISASENTAPTVPDGYEVIYVLTQSDQLIITAVNDSPDFEVEDNGLHTIHTLVYDPNTLDLGIVEFGVTTGADVYGLLEPGGGEICGDLDVAGAPVIVEAPEAGTLTADMDEGCYFGDSVMISATHNGDWSIPDGYSFIYVLTQGEELVIIDAAATPEFQVGEPGMYTIHTLIYNPATLDLGIVEFGVTTGVDVFGLIVPGGGAICADLDVAGAPVEVKSPDAGTVTADMDTVCKAGMDTLIISATPNGDINIPEGYSSIYVLTRGAGLVIVDADFSPEFTVSEGGMYTIHTLVFDTATLDLGIIEFGVTTGVDVLGLIVPGGGDICADLDVAGAPVYVECPDAGSLTADISAACYFGDPVVISASVDIEANVPDGYNIIYVLTQGEDLVIVDAADVPEFMVDTTGLFTIHTLVYNPATLDLGIVEFGVTTGVDVFGLLVPGGGSICADLDVAGAPFQVSDPDAGTLTADMDTVCTAGMDTTSISAAPNGDINIPDGYSSIYVLTQGAGLVIVDAGASPEFDVTEGGLYTIHTLVYDPETLDLGIIEFGVTTGVDVFGLIVPGGGDICADLDVAGAPVFVCEVNGGTITTDDNTTICVDGIGDPIDVALSGNVGENTAWVITDEAGEILALPAGPPFDLDGAGAGVCLIWHLSWKGELTGAMAGNNAADLEGCFDLSNPITVTRYEVDGGTIATEDDTVICAGDGIADPIDVALTGAAGSNSAWVITDASLEILALPAGPPFDLEGAGGGTCLIWHLSWEGDLTGAEVGLNAADLSGDCFDLSNAITVVRNGVDGGEISTLDPTTICAGDGIPDPINVTLTGNEGSNSAWVITDESLEILALPPGSPFDLDGAGAGVCLIWHLSWEGELTGAEVGMNAADLMGCFNLSNAITVTRDTSGAVCSPSGVFSNISDRLNVEIFPNPVRDVLLVEFELQRTVGDMELEIFNAYGQSVLRRSLTGYSGSFTEAFELDGNATGQYILNIRTDDGFLSQPFIKTE